MTKILSFATPHGVGKKSWPILTEAEAAELPPFRFLLKSAFANSWLILFILLATTLFERSSHSLSLGREHLEKKREELRMAISENLQTRKAALERLGSVDDDLWIEGLLISQLGLIPEKSKKVRFRNP